MALVYQSPTHLTVLGIRSLITHTLFSLLRALDTYTKQLKKNWGYRMKIHLYAGYTNSSPTESLLLLRINHLQLAC